MNSFKRKNIYAVLYFTIFSAMPIAHSNSINSPRAYLRIPTGTGKITIDGKIDKDEWKDAAFVTNFINAGNNKLAQEQTRINFTHDDNNLYMAFHMKEFALNPVSNQMESFKAKHQKRDARIWQDDAVEIKLESVPEDGKVSPIYYFCFNANAAILDMIHRGTDWDKKWNGELTIKANTNDKGFWEAEVKIPFKTLGKKFKNWKFLATRFEQRLKERSSWVCLAGGDHTSLNNYGYLELGSSESAARIAPFTKSDFTKGILNIAAVGKKVSPIATSASVYYGDNPLFDKFEKYKGKNGFVKINKATELRAEKAKMQYCLLSDNDGLLYRSPAFNYAVERSTSDITVRSDEPFELYINGEKLSENKKKISKLSINLTPGINSVAIRTRNGNAISAIMNFDGQIITTGSTWKAGPAEGNWQEADFDDSKWRRAEVVDKRLLENATTIASPTTGEVVFRKIIMKKATVFWPSCEDNTWHLTANGTYTMQCGNGAINWKKTEPLSKFKMIIEVPEGLTLVGATSTNVEYTCEKIGEQKHNGVNFVCYEIKRDLPRYGGMEVAIRADKNSQGKLLPIYFRLSAFDDYYQEVNNVRFCRILPELKGKQPKKIVIFIIAKATCKVKDSKIQRQHLQTLKDAGVTELWGDYRSTIPREVGLGQSHHFKPISARRGLWSGPLMDIDSIIEKYPEAQSYNIKGRKSGQGVCLSYLARNDGPWEIIEEEVKRIINRCPSLTYFMFDYEYTPIPGDSYPMFSDCALNAFQKEYNINTKIKRDEIAEKYYDQYVDFTCKELATFCGRLRDILHKYGKDMCVYSGWHSARTKSRYGVDWKYMADNIDRAYCGYGHSIALINNTREAMKGKPVVGGLIISGKQAKSHNAAELMLKIADCGGGVLCWYSARFDGKALHEISIASQATAEYEDYLLNGKRCEKTILDMQIGNLKYAAAYMYKGRLLIILSNTRANEMRFKFSVKNSHNKVFVEFYTGKSIKARPSVDITVPGGRIRALLVDL